ncbi:MAG TPA: helix-turn-helix domain-containing protein [Pyrinomonadaceae bacterium]|nr:helix-turn-helix domain-containing protein [Pyrinomonadaceae bacterium]
MKILNYQPVPNTDNNSDVEHRIDQLVMLAKALASEIETLKAELGGDQNQPVDLSNDGIDFYDEIERYEIELIRSALNQCGGNQAQAAKLLHLKSTTLNAKMKHYGLNPVRSIMFQRQKATQTK